AKENDYRNYIDTNPDLFSNPATVEQVQAMVNSLNTPVVTPTPVAPIPLNITLEDRINSPYFVASLKSIDGDIQGVLTTTGVSINLNYTINGVNARGVIKAYSQTVNVPASNTQDGIARTLVFSYPETTYGSGSQYPTSIGRITATLKAVGGDLKLKQLKTQTAGNAIGALIAGFTYVTNSAGAMGTLNLKSIGAIPDRNFTSKDMNRQNYYLPVISSTTGKTWLNNNLGALYANANFSQFNPAQQAKTIDDDKAFGSLYQWGRGNDDHELRRSSINYDTPSATKSVTQFRNQFIAISNGNNWYTGTAPNDLWQGEAGTNNPCPHGYRLPIAEEILKELDGFDTVEPQRRSPSSLTAFNSNLRLTPAGKRRGTDGILISKNGTGGAYWSSTVNFNSNTVNVLVISNPSGVSISDSNYNHVVINIEEKTSGASVRCIKN
ncbi:MAG: hypothetical protein ACWIPJ_02880, partial [Polaribacter sp.]